MNEIMISEKRIDECTHDAKAEELENRRLKLRRRVLTFRLTTCAAVIVFIAVCRIWYMPGQWRAYATAGAIVILALWLFRAFYVMSLRRKLHKSFRKEMMGHYIATLLPDATFHPDKSLETSVLADSHLFSIPNDRCKGSDFTTATLDGADLCFGWMKATYRKAINTQKGTKTSWHQLFTGWMLQLKPDKYIDGCTLVIPVETEEYPGGWGKWLQQTVGEDGQMIQFEQGRFAREFNTFSTNPEGARKILTESVQSILISIRQKYKGDIRLSFTKSAVYLAIESKQAFVFQPKLSLKDAKTPQVYLQPLPDVLPLMHAIQLNLKML